MVRLTHRTSPGWTYFVTTKAWQGVSVFQVRETADIVINKILEYRDRRNYLLHEFVLMPNHLHLILTPEEAVSLEKAIQLIKDATSHKIHAVPGNTMQFLCTVMVLQRPPSHEPDTYIAGGGGE